MKNDLAIFEEHEIRQVYDEETETWFFSVIDIVQVLTAQTDYQTTRNYWNVLKNRLKKEGNQTLTKCKRLKMIAEDGRSRFTDTANAETLLRLVQSIPSPKAEPVKLWLAKVGYERMQEMADPSKSLDRARETWQKHGYSEKWIQQRMMGQETRNKLTDYWKDHGVEKPDEFAILTNIIHQEWTGISVKDHKNSKGLKSENLQDHMSEAELIFTALAELSTRQIAETMNATGMEENKLAGKKGGDIAKKARMELEHKTRKKVISKNNYLPSNKSTKNTTEREST